MISLSQTRYGSARLPRNARQGSTRRWTSYQASNLAEMGEIGIMATMAQPPKVSQDSAPSHNAPGRRGRAGAIGADAGAAAATAFARAGFADPALVLHWQEIAGADVARLARPVS